MHLTGAAATKELKFEDLGPNDQRTMREAMDAEWQKWLQFNAVKYVSKDDWAALQKSQGKTNVVRTR